MTTTEALTITKQLLAMNRDRTSTMHGVLNRRFVAALNLLRLIAKNQRTP